MGPGWQSASDLWSWIAGNTPTGERNLPIPSRIRGPEVIILSRKRFSKNSSYNPIKTTNRHAQNDRKDRGKISSFHNDIFQSNSCFSWKPTLPVLCTINSLHHVFMSHGWAGLVQQLVLYRAASTASCSMESCTASLSESISRKTDTTFGVSGNPDLRKT